jgi:hypothetical protein
MDVLNPKWVMIGRGNSPLLSAFTAINISNIFELAGNHL